MSTLALCIAFVLLALGRWIYNVRAGGRHPHWKEFPGPKREMWLIGNRMVKPKEEREAEPDPVLREYTEQYGVTFVYPDVLGQDKLYTTDPVTITAMLNDIDTFTMNSATQAAAKLVSGGGLVAAFSAEHKRMRKAISPSFATAQLRNIFLVLRQKAVQLSDRTGDTVDAKEGEQFNFCPLLDSAALDAIAEAGFGYKNGALEKGTEESVLSKTFTNTLKVALKGLKSMFMMVALGHLISPYLVELPINETNRTLLRQKKILTEVATSIIESKKEGLRGMDKATIGNELGSEKDILSSIVRHNLISPPQSSLSDEELVGQVGTFLFAGFETTATTSSWILWHLSRDAELQQRLYTEITSFMSTEAVTSVADLTYEQIWDDSKLGFLGRCILETLRMHPPVQSIERTAQKDTVLPRQEGGMIAVKKGNHVVAGVASFNFLEKYYGKNPHKFNPDRWLDLPPAHAEASLQPYGSFNFSTGPKGCIGSKFALTEMRSFLFELVSNFRFEPTEDKIVTRQALVMRPIVMPSDGAEPYAAMPLRVVRRK